MKKVIMKNEADGPTWKFKHISVEKSVFKEFFNKENAIPDST